MTSQKNLEIWRVEYETRYLYLYLDENKRVVNLEWKQKLYTDDEVNKRVIEILRKKGIL